MRLSDELQFISDFYGESICEPKSIEEGHIQQGNKKMNEKRIHPC